MLGSCTGGDEINGQLLNNAMRAFYKGRWSFVGAHYIPMLIFFHNFIFFLLQVQRLLSIPKLLYLFLFVFVLLGLIYSYLSFKIGFLYLPPKKIWSYILSL